MKPGIYADLPREQYDAIEAVNFSTLRHIKKSPAHYRSVVMKRDKDTDPKKVGRATHLAVFEPERFGASVAVWDGKVRRGKEWDAFREKHAGRELLTENEHAECLRIQASVRGDPIAKEYVEKGRGELTMVWELDGLRCKGRIDFDGERGIVDLKTTRDASAEAFGRAVNEYSYHVQAAWYGDGYALLTGQVKPYFVIAAENDEPYIVQVYRVPDPLLAAGRREYREWLDRLLFCRSQNWWPGYADQVLDVTLPRWATPAPDASEAAK